MTNGLFPIGLALQVYYEDMDIKLWTWLRAKQTDPALSTYWGKTAVQICSPKQRTIIYTVVIWESCINGRERSSNTS
ncbi:unnamed protein product [Rhodiola kirilowii]